MKTTAPRHSACAWARAALDAPPMSCQAPGPLQAGCQRPKATTVEAEAFLPLNPLLFIWSFFHGNCPPKLTVLCHLRRNFPVRCRHSGISRNVLTFYPTWQVQLRDPHTPVRGVHGRPLPSEFHTLSCLPRPPGWGGGGAENASGCFLPGPQSRPEILQRGTESISHASIRAAGCRVVSALGKHKPGRSAADLVSSLTASRP